MKTFEPAAHSKESSKEESSNRNSTHLRVASKVSQLVIDSVFYDQPENPTEDKE